MTTATDATHTLIETGLNGMTVSTRTRPDFSTLEIARRHVRFTAFDDPAREGGGDLNSLNVHAVTGVQITPGVHQSLALYITLADGSTAMITLFGDGTDIPVTFKK
jgi:hypothetical protein